MANCAMMNIPRDVAEQLSLYEYEETLWHWNEAHRSPDEVEPPEAEKTQRLLDRINADPRLTGAKPPKVKAKA